MINPQRGDVAIAIAGRTHRLSLTLGALAEIEAALDCDGLEALARRLEKLDAAALQTVLSALLRAAGAEDGAALAAAADARAAARAVADCFTANLS